MYVTVSVEVDMSEFDTDDLERELRNRGKAGGVSRLGENGGHPLHEIFYALKFGMTDRALELTRLHVCEELGVVL